MTCTRLEDLLATLKTLDTQWTVNLGVNSSPTSLPEFGFTISLFSQKFLLESRQ